MSHATEGELHAYLDGALAAIDEAGAERLVAHLGRCADCRARLEAEGAIRDRAAELLGTALPAVEPPPFETIAGAGPTVRRRASTERLAWAAAVVVALGAGWFGNALLRQSPDSLVPAASRSLEQAAADEDASADAAVSNEPVAETETAGSGEETAPIASALESPRRSEAAPSTNAPPEEASSRVDALENARIGDALAERQVANVAGREVGVASEAEAPPPADPPADLRAGADEGFADREARLQSRENAKAAPVELDDATAALGAVAWSEVDEAEATRLLGRTPLRVPDLDVVGFDAGSVDDTRLVRVRQRLPGGEPLTIVQELAAPAGERAVALEGRLDYRESESPPEPAAEVANEAVSRDRAGAAAPLASVRNIVEGVLVILQASLASDSLEVLASRIR